MRLISKISKNLPKPIKKSLRWIYYKWTSKIDKEIINDLTEYFNLNQREVGWLLKSGSRLNTDFWYILNPKTEKEIEEFYKIIPFYVFELVFWHGKRTQHILRSEIIKLTKGKVLDYGGGIGDLSIDLSKKGFIVDYADVYGNTFEFAKWLFQKKDYNIKMIDLNKEKLSKKYNTIICIDVIEHIVNAKTVLKNLVAHLENNGSLIITNLNAPVLEEHPMHIKMEFNAEGYLNSLGLHKIKKSWLWIKS